MPGSGISEATNNG